MNLLSQWWPGLLDSGWRSSPLARRLLGSDETDIETLCAMMMDSDGDYSSLLIAERILDAYESLDDAGRLEFFTLLSERYDLDADATAEFAREYALDPSLESLRKLTQAAEPRRQELFRRINLSPGGTRRLVKMREHLLAISREHPQLQRIDADFRHLFGSWFNRGFLSLQPVDWTTPAHILEKIIAYEAVHEIQSWNELRRRLEPADRHCYAFFHPAMGDEPLVFVEVALTDSMPVRIGDILERGREPMDPGHASHAVFYSISNCHRGLAGVSFGNFLIKQVATSLKQRFPTLKSFVTLSPAPGFVRWLGSDESTAALADPERAVEAETLLPLAARYYLQAKNASGEPEDPVARFHLKNGARLEQINPGADPSEKGLRQSLGLMVNYVYDLARVEENHEEYMKDHTVVSSSQIRKLLKSQ